jgi:hypothetical protein
MAGLIPDVDWGKRWLLHIPQLDPAEGTTVLEPPGSGPGHWAGAPSILFDAEDVDTYYLYYRLRKPRGEGRGYMSVVADSADGVSFEPIWEAHKDAFDSPSVERGCLVKTPGGRYRLYLSLVDRADGTWKTDMMEADDPSRFDPDQRVRVLDPVPLGLAGVKDPYVMVIGGLYWAVVSYAPLPGGEDAAELHATEDAYATGLTRSHTGLALSADGIHFDWVGDILSPAEGRWDAYAARIGSVLPVGPWFLAFYDGGASVEENYEEKCGLALSLDLRTFYRVSVDRPFAVSPEGSGALRYLDAITVDDDVLLYYEYCRADGSHELRMNRLPG